MTYLEAKSDVLDQVVASRCHICGSPVVLSVCRMNCACPRGCGIFCHSDAVAEAVEMLHGGHWMPRPRWKFYPRPPAYGDGWWEAVARNTGRGRG